MVPAAVVADDDEHWQLHAGGCLEVEPGEAERAVSHDQDHRSLRPGDLRRNGETGSDAETAKAAGIEPVFIWPYRHYVRRPGDDISAVSDHDCGLGELLVQLSYHLVWGEWRA